MSKRDKMLAHAEACRDAMARGDSPPMLPDDQRDYAGADLSGADLSGAELSGADLRNADLRNAALTGANLTGACLNRASLRGADLRCVPLTGACLNMANLRGADLTWADLYGTGTVRLIGSYESTIYPDGRLAYGCVTHTLDEWGKRVVDLCAEHEPSRAAYFEAEIRAILALARVVVAGREA